MRPHPSCPDRAWFRRPVRLSRKRIGGRSHFQAPMPPGGWRSMPNPDGAGFLLEQDPDRIDYRRGMADRVLRGDSICSVVTWLNDLGPPLAGASQKRRNTVAGPTRRWSGSRSRTRGLRSGGGRARPRHGPLPTGAGSPTAEMPTGYPPEVRHTGASVGVDPAARTTRMLSRGFSRLKSAPPGPLAQSVEHRTFNPPVVGSSPTGPTAHFPGHRPWPRHTVLRPPRSREAVW